MDQVAAPAGIASAAPVRNAISQLSVIAPPTATAIHRTRLAVRVQAPCIASASAGATIRSTR